MPTVSTIREQLVAMSREWRQHDNIPQRFMKYTWKDLKVKTSDSLKAAAKAAWYYKEDYPGYLIPYHNLILGGPVGVGKTTLAVLIARSFPAPSIFMTAQSLVQRVLEGFKQRDLAEFMVQLTTVPLLVIDDIARGAQETNSSVRSIIDDIVDHRYTEELPIVVTSNIPIETMAQDLFPHMAERLLDGAVELVITGKSMRELQ